MNLRRNSAFAVAEVVVYGLGLFFIYRNVVQVLGISMLGVWSLVLATTAFGRAADVGITGGIASENGRRRCGIGPGTGTVDLGFGSWRCGVPPGTERFSRHAGPGPG